MPNPAKRSAAGVERVLGDAARRPGRESLLGLPSRRRGLAPGAAEGQAPQSVAGWQREGSPASRLHQTLWLESIILTLAENAFPAIPRPAGGTSSAEPVCRGHLPYAGGGGGE